MILLDTTQDILDRARRITFFHAVGHPLADASVVAVHDWRTALKALASIASRNFFLEATNEISATAFLRNQPEFNQWNKIVDAADKVLTPEILPRIMAILPVKGKRLPLANEVLLQRKLAAVERQLRIWHDSDFFLNVFGWLECGHLPCGGTAGFPQGKLLVY